MRYVFLLLILLASCGTPGPATLQVKTQDVDKAVAVSCVPKDFPGAPAPTLMVEALKAASGPVTYQLLSEFWLQAAPRLTLDEGVITSCKKPLP